MTPRYWIKIVLGMLGVFVVGMLVAEAIQQGKTKVHRLVESNAAVTLPMFGVPFMLGDTKLGAMQSLRVERDAPRVVSGFHLKVRLDDPSALDTLAVCQISLDDFDSIDEHSHFICVAPADSIAQGMERFGTITFEPSGQVHTLLAPADVRHELRTAMVDDAAQADGSTAVAIDSADGGNVSVKINGQQVIDIHGDSAGGHVIIKDPSTGKTLVEVKGGPGN